MFTGIVQGLGVLGERRGPVLQVEVPEPMRGRLAIGASIAVNGVCLTMRELGVDSFWVDLSPETVSRTTLGEMCRGMRVNLELPVSPSGLLDGHLVLGHIDTVGRIKTIRKEDGGWRLVVAFPAEHRGWLAEKGSVAVDGISLTPFSITGTTFQCAIVPQTYAETTLREKVAGDPVNLEFDILGKYVAEAIARDHAH